MWWFYWPSLVAPNNTEEWTRQIHEEFWMLTEVYGQGSIQPLTWDNNIQLQLIYLRKLLDKSPT